MKTRTLLSLVLLSLLLFGVTVAIASEDHGHNDHEVADHCDTPTAELTIKADTTLNKYDAEEYQVEKNTCYELKFENQNEFTEHDVNIDEVGDHDSEVHMEKVHIHVANNTDGENGIRSMHIMTPDADTVLTIYCSVEGHQDAGMEATLIVGDGDSALPFNAFYSILGLLFIVSMLPILRRR